MSLVAGSASAATIVLFNTNDVGIGSLRWAIGEANSNAGPDTITFAIPGTGPHTIPVLGVALPTITNTATAIRGDTQPGFSNNTPVIQILGPSATPTANDYGLFPSGLSITIRCVRVSGFGLAGIVGDGFNPKSVRIEGCVLDQNGHGLQGGGSGLYIGGTSTNARNVIINNLTNGIHLFWGHVKIQGNYIGVAADGVTAAGNGENGIWMSYWAGTNTIQGATNYPQVISGNGLNGIFCDVQGAYITGSSDNDIVGNYIGTDATGTNAVPNGANGIRIWGGSSNTIGGTTVAARNIIAGNTNAGVSIQGIHPIYDKRDNVVLGNYIGLGADGETVVSNGVGVRIDDAFGNTIGGTVPGSGNRFGGAKGENVLLVTTYAPCISNLVQGNWFGISASTQRLSGGTAGVRMFSYQILAEGTSYNLIGGTTTNARNYFGGANTGVAISGTNSQFNLIVGNWIGVGPGGVQIANNSYGVDIFNAPRNQIGGVFTNDGNVISGNQYYGIRINGTNACENVVMGNIIGLDPTSQFAISNRYDGIGIISGARSNRVGGTNAATMNVIAGNGSDGIYIADPLSYGNEVFRNFIGLNRTNHVIGNKSSGIQVFQSPRNLIGPANIIGGNSSVGVFINGTSAVGNVVFSNYIGQDNGGTARPNNGGIDVLDAPGNINDGISVRGMSSGTVVRGNFVGLQFPGLNVALPNTSDGIYVNAPFVIVGGTNAGNVNYFSGNINAGVNVGSGGTNAFVAGNVIGLDTTGLAIISNRGVGVSISGPGVVLGSIEAYGRNIISGNMNNGVDIIGPARDVTVQNCYIGLDGAGTTHMSNRQYSVYINNATNVTFGGAGPSRRNVVTSGRLEGVFVAGSSSNITILGNYIGTSADGLSALPNPSGIRIDSSHVTIGGTNALEGNLISGNNGVGIDIYTGSNIRVVGNIVGLASDGVTPLPNTAGIWVYSGASGVTIGGTNAGERNVIARNTGREIEIVGPSSGNRVIGNYIGVQDGGVAFSIGADNDEAIFVNNSPNNQILNNVIGQENIGIQLNGTGTFNTVIRGNFIGEYNLESISNKSWGIQIINSSSNTIGGIPASERNLITRNVGGIAVTNNGSFVAVANRIAPNLIHSNGTRLNIELGPNGFNTNDALDADSGANRLQNRPVITNAITLSPAGFSIVYAQGILTSAPNTTYVIDVYRSFGTNAEAYRYLGSVPLTTDGGGVGLFSGGFPVNIATNIYLTATATDPEGNTSEFAVAPTGTLAKTTADFDSDGIPDYWEVLYGLNMFFSNAGLDLDGDGVSDYDEYIADTPANDPTKFLEIVDLAGTAPRTLTFPSSQLRRYELHYTTNLLTNTWAVIGGTVTGQILQTSVTDTNDAPLRHYRIGVKLP